MVATNETIDFDPPLRFIGEARAASREFENFFVEFATYMKTDHPRHVNVKTVQQYERDVRNHFRISFGIDIQHGRPWSRLKAHYRALATLYPDKHRVRLPLTKAILHDMKDGLDKLWDKLDRPARIFMLTCWTRNLLDFYLVCRWSCLQGVPKSAVTFSATAINISIDKHKTSKHVQHIFTHKVLPRPDPADGDKYCPSKALVRLLTLTRHNTARTGPPNPPLFELADGSELGYYEFQSCTKFLIQLTGRSPDEYDTHSGRGGGSTLHLSCPSSNSYLTACQGFWTQNKSMRPYTQPTETAMLRVLCEMKQARNHEYRPLISAGDSA